MCAYTSTNDGAQLVLAQGYPGLELSPGVSFFGAFSYIFASSAHMTIIFTYSETLLYILSRYVHFILLFCLPPMSATLLCGLVDAGAYELTPFVFPPTTTRLSNTLSTPRQHIFSIFDDYVAHL